MAILKSTDEQFRVLKRTPKIKFASVYSSGNGTVLRICASIARKALFMGKVVLSYDTDKNELIIEGNLGGNVSIINDGSLEVNSVIFISRWLKAFNINVKYGRYEASIDENNCVHVYFDRKIDKE